MKWASGQSHDNGGALPPTPLLAAFIVGYSYIDPQQVVSLDIARYTLMAVAHDSCRSSDAWMFSVLGEDGERRDDTAYSPDDGAAGMELGRPRSGWEIKGSGENQLPAVREPRNQLFSKLAGRSSQVCHGILPPRSHEITCDSPSS